MLPIVIAVGVGIGLWGLLRNRGSSGAKVARIGFSTEKEIGDKILMNLDRHGKAQLHALTSPFPFINDEAWRNFVDWAQRGKLNTITENYNLGLYLLNLRQLETIGLVSRIRQVLHRKKMVIEGAWKIPRDQFLSDPLLQYQAFTKIAGNYLHALMDVSYVGRTLQEINQIESPTAYEVIPMTLSGLLAVMFTCGPFRMESWLLEPEDRKHHYKTAQAFIDANGIF